MPLSLRAFVCCSAAVGRLRVLPQLSPFHSRRKESAYKGLVCATRLKGPYCCRCSGSRRDGAVFLRKGDVRLPPGRVRAGGLARRWEKGFSCISMPIETPNPRRWVLQGLFLPDKALRRPPRQRWGDEGLENIVAFPMTSSGKTEEERKCRLDFPGSSTVISCCGILPFVFRPFTEQTAPD